MRRNVIYMLLVLLSSIKLYSQEIYQQTTIELDESFDENKSYVCQATRSIELSPGFVYVPNMNEKMSLEIDRYSIYPPSEGTYGGNYNGEECVVGSIPGVFTHGGTGSANYSVDIQLPQALGTMTPKLSVTYNSQSANGLFGWSWDLLGLSSIERMGQTEYHDGKLTSVDFVNDRYVIDGQRMMSIGNDEYKTEIDNLDKINSYNGNKKGPDYFIVWKADGTIWEYGTTEDSKVEPQGRNDVVLKWLVSKITDRNGNVITYNYYEDNTAGEAYINSIDYTSNVKADVKPAYGIHFKYKERVDKSVGYICGSKISNTKIIDKIEVQNNYSGKKIIEYSFKYDEPAYYDNNYYLHYRLNSIHLTIDDKKVNPTRIVWNSKEKWATDKSCGYKKYELNKNVFNRVSFVGDFNGDGFSDVLLLPYKVQNTYNADVEGEVYLNNRDGTFSENPLVKVAFNKNLDWIYVCDINGDGVDDIIPYGIYFDENGALDKVEFSLLMMCDGKFLNKKTYTYEKLVTLLPGTYISKDNCGILVLDSYNGKKNKDLAKFIYMKNGELITENINNSNIINGKDISCMTMDITGNGISELLSLDESGYNIYSIKNTDALTLVPCGSGNDFTNKIHPFPNDYNGDGKMDLLYYDPAQSWNIVVSTGCGFTKPVRCVKNNVLQNVRLNDKDRYRYSLKEMQKPTVTIRTADFDGDGVADVGVFNNAAGNYYLQIGFSPYMNTQTSYSFSYYKRYYMPINYSHQTIQLGRFLPQENVSVLSGLPRNPSNASKAYIVSICPNSAYYSVEKIIDGLSNTMELLYDYLVKGKDDFYTCSGNDHYNVTKKSVPVLALKEQKTYSINGKAIVKKYEYHNALVHKKGRGFLGFEQVLVRSYMDDNIVNRQIRRYNLETLDSYCIPLLTYERLFYGENQLVKDNYFEYEKYSCNKNSKVILPLLVKNRETVYDVDRKRVVLKSIITTNIYEPDISLDKQYESVVRLKKTTKGYDNLMLDSPEEAQYFEEKSFDYDDDMNDWIINRPKKIIKCLSGSDNDMIGDVVLLEYDTKYPMKVVKETIIPNIRADVKDSLTLVTKYKYDVVGNVVEQAISSPSLKKDKVIKSEYGANYKYRYKTKSIDEMGREVVCKYDDNFGVLKSTVDYNNLTTHLDNAPFGIMSTVIMPDGMENVKTLRWSENNKYAPRNSSYYCWEKSKGKAETMIFYHKSGAELRKVTFDIHGRAVIVDKEYDDYDNIKQESYPYYENDDKLYVRNIYDAYNRIVETIYPNGSNITYTYDGNTIHTEYTTADALKKYKKESYNIMGWVTNVEDNGGNEIKYEYYSDGKIKYTQIGNNITSRISITYDNRRNRSSVYDPNCGLMSYKNDALGNITKMSNTQYVVEIEYDVLGRMISRNENDLRHDKKKMVRWEYSNDYGYNGLLKNVCSTDGHRIEYVYDDKLRMRSSIESIEGKKFKTTYTYDDANRISTISYPSGFTILKKYSNTGYETMICDADTEKILWKTCETNSNGCITECQLGNGVKTKYTYNPYNFMLEKIESRKDDVLLQDLSYKYNDMGNLIYRCDEDNYEEFEYDTYDRLTKIILNGDLKGKMSYLKNGNIIDKEVNGVKVIYDAIYGVDKINAILNAKTDDEKMYERFYQNIKYSTYDNVVSVDAEDKSLSINYGYDNDRISMQYRVGDKVKSKIYAGSCEYIEENGKAKLLTYIEGPMGVFAVHVDDGEERLNYIHKDNLESWNVITSEDGSVLQKVSFDAWGNIRNPERWDEGFEDMSMLYDRGFTGHEHLWDFGLINMNGRFYDPLMSMMLSPDNNIQIPQSSQNFNRYSYCLNNPLKYYDPTGEWVESIVWGVVGGAANLVVNARDIDSFGEAALLFGSGFLKGFLVGITMGQSWFLQVGVGAVTEGIVSGANQIVSISDGSFDLSGDDWNSVKSASHYGLGSGLVKSFMYTYMTEPTDEQYGESFFESSYHREFAHGLISVAAHGMGCWFSGQPFLTTMKFKDVGFDLKMLGIIAKRLLSSYIYNLGFGEEALDKRANDIKESILQGLREEIPDTPDFNYICELLGVFVEDFRVYVVGNIFQMIPGEIIDAYPKPYLEEVITFPFSYSLFKTLFFNKQ